MRDLILETLVEITRNVCTSLHSLRNKKQLRIRQPLPVLQICGLAENFLSEYAKVISDEEYKDIIFNALGDEEMSNHIFNELVSSEMITECLTTISDETNVKKVSLVYKDQLPQEDNTHLVNNNNFLTIVLCIEVTPELHREYLAREFVRAVQGSRKQDGFDITDKIDIFVSPDSELLLDILELKH